MHFSICHSELLSFLGRGKNNFYQNGFSWEHAFIVLLAPLVSIGINIQFAKLKSAEPVLPRMNISGLQYGLQDAYCWKND
jgi:uncharacterized membrane protein